MPQAVVAAAAWVATAATAAAAAVGVSTTMASAMAIYTSVQAVATVALSVGVQVGISALTSPKVGGVGMTGSQVDFQSNPDAGIPYAVGETGTAGVYVYNTVGEAKNRNLLFNSVLSLGPIEGFTGFKADGEEVVFGGLQQAVGGKYANRMWQNRQLGATPAGTFVPPNTTDASVLAEWTSAHKLSGLAASWYVISYDQKTYASGAPAPMWKLKGVKVYDPRQDSTYPGGSGPQRWNDEATWAWSDNPWIHALTWCIGRKQNGRRVMGLGCALAGIDVAAFVEAANVADANDWKVSGVVYSTDSKWEVLKAFCQAGGGRPIALGAKVSCLVNAPRVSIATLTGADIEGDPTITATQSRRSRINAGVPRYRSEAHGWDIVAADPLIVAEYVAEDAGQQRTQEIEFPLVPDVTQAAQLTAYAITGSREFGPNIIPVTPAKGWALKPGDCITINEPELGLVGQKMLVVERERNLTTGGRILTCISETDAKHDYCLGRSGTPPPTPGLSGLDVLPSAPTVGSWSAVGGALLGSDGAKIPAIIVTGEVDDPNATHLIVEYRQVSVGPTYGPWVSNEYPSSSTRIEIAGVKSAATYQVRVRYRTIRGLENTEVFLDLGLVIVGSLSTAEVDGVPASQVVQGLRDLAARGSEAYQALIKLSLDQAAANGALEAKTFTTDGLPVGPLAYEQKIITAGLVQFSTLLGIISEDESAIILNQMTVEVSPGQSLASFLTYVESVLGDGEVSITFLLEAINGVAGRISLAVQNDTEVVGLDLGVDGTTSHFDMVSNKFRFIDPNGVGAPTTVLSYSGGKWKFNADLYAQKLVAAIIEAEHLTVGSVTLEAILAGATSGKESAYTTTRINSVADGASVISDYYEPATNRGVEVRYNASWHFPSSRTTLRLGLYRDGSYVTGSGRQCSFDGQDEVIMAISFQDPFASAGSDHLYEVVKIAGTSCDQIEASIIMEELRR